MTGAPRPIAAIVLAAGAGRRMGGRPKALLPIDGEPFLARVTRGCREGGCEPIYVVVPPAPPELLALARSLGSHAVVNPEPEHGMFSSVQRGISALLETGDPPAGCILFPVDHPRVQSSTLRSLMEALPEAGAMRWVRPVFARRGGHPVLIPREALRQLLDRDPGEPLRDALRGIGLEPFDAPVEDPGILANLNLPDDLAS